MEQLKLPDAHFDGETYVPEFDHDRLKGQMLRVYKLLSFFGKGHQLWLSLADLERGTGDPQASISARIRDLRKAKFGSHNVHKRRRGNPSMGVWEYLLHQPMCQCSLCIDTDDPLQGSLPNAN